MSGESISPNMSLVLPGVGVTSGPQYAEDLNDSLTTIDQHDHSAGSGVPVTPNGLNINQDLSFINNNAINLRSSRFLAQPTPLALSADLGCLYVSGVDLYYNDTDGNQIPITQNGGVAGTPGSISNLSAPASAAYVSGSSTFVWQSDINTPANMDFASAILRNLSANSKGLTLAPPAAMSNDYTITLPALPASTLPISISNTGTMSAGQITTAQITDLNVTTAKINDAAITTAKIADANVTKPKLAALGQQISISGGVALGTATSYTDLTNLSVTITTTGRPVFLGFIPDTGSNSQTFLASADPSSVSANIRFMVGSVELCVFVALIARDFQTIVVPCSSMSGIFLLSAGTYTLKAQYLISGVGSFNMSGVKLVAYEL